MLLAELAEPKVQTSSLLWMAVADICTCTGLYKSAVSRMHVCEVLNVTLLVTTWLHPVTPPQLLFGSTTTGTTPVAAAAALSALFFFSLSHDQCRSAKPSDILLLSSLPRAFAEHLLLHRSEPPPCPLCPVLPVVAHADKGGCAPWT